MRSTLVCLLALLTLWSCKKDTPNPEMEAILTLEKKIESGSTSEQVQELIGLYEAYVAGHPEEAEANAQILHKAAYLQYTGHRYASAVKYLKEGMRKYYPSSKTPESGLFLASIYKNQMGSELLGNAAYQAFLQAFPRHEKVAYVRDTVLTATVDLSAEIDSLRAGIYNEASLRYDNTVANDFIGICEIYGLFLPDDARSPDLIYEAARTAGYIRSFPKAVELYDWVYLRYPDYPKASQALFMMAFTYDNEMRNLEKARALYEEFLRKYPGDDFEDDAQALLQNLGKSEEEVLKNLQTNQ